MKRDIKRIDDFPTSAVRWIGKEVERVEDSALVTPSPVSPLDAKGCGEGAIHPAPAAVFCAINDALAPLGVVAREVPASPQRLWRLLREAQEAEGGKLRDR